MDPNENTNQPDPDESEHESEHEDVTDDEWLASLNPSAARDD